MGYEVTLRWLDWIDLIVVSLWYLPAHQKSRHNNLSEIYLHIAKYRHIKKSKQSRWSTIWMVGCAITL